MVAPSSRTGVREVADKTARALRNIDAVLADRMEDILRIIVLAVSKGLTHVVNSEYPVSGAISFAHVLTIYPISRINFKHQIEVCCPTQRTEIELL